MKIVVVDGLLIVFKNLMKVYWKNDIIDNGVWLFLSYGKLIYKNEYSFLRV